MRYRYMALMVLMLSGVMSCEQSQRTAKAINGVNQEFSDRIEMSITMVPLTPEQNNELRAKLKRTPIPPGEGYDVRVYRNGGRTFVGNMTVPRHVVTVDKIDEYYSSVLNASSYALASPVTDQASIESDSALDEWRDTIGSAWLDCS